MTYPNLESDMTTQEALELHELRHFIVARLKTFAIVPEDLKSRCINSRVESAHTFKWEGRLYGFDGREYYYLRPIDNKWMLADPPF